MPPFLETAFDTTTSRAIVGYEEPPPDLSVDFVSLLHNFAKDFDFTKVDQDAAMNFVNTAAKHASKVAFEQGSQIVDKGLEWLAGGSAVAQQWYITAAALVSEQALDWAEKKFSTYMGWDELDSFTRGDWILIYFGTVPSQLWEHPEDVNRRRRLGGKQRTLEGVFGDMSEEAVYRGHEASLAEVQHAYHIGLATGNKQVSSSGNYIEAIDIQTGVEKYFPAQDVRRLEESFAKSLDADVGLAKIKALVSDPNTRLPNQMAVQVNTRIGDRVEFYGDQYQIVKGAAHGKFRLEANGNYVDVPYDDADLQPAWNDTTYRPLPGGQGGGFVTLGGYNAGDYLWVKQDSDEWLLHCMHSAKGEELFVFNATTGAQSRANIRSVRPVNRDFPRSGLWGQFIDAVRSLDGQRAKAVAPGRKYPNDCRAHRTDYSKFGKLPKQSFWEPPTGGQLVNYDYDKLPTAKESQEQDSLDEYNSLNQLDMDWEAGELGYGRGFGQDTGELIPSATVGYVVLLVAAASAAYVLTR